MTVYFGAVPPNHTRQGHSVRFTNNNDKYTASFISLQDTLITSVKPSTVEEKEAIKAVIDYKQAGRSLNKAEALLESLKQKCLGIGLAQFKTSASDSPDKEEGAKKHRRAHVNAANKYDEAGTTYIASRLSTTKKLRALRAQRDPKTRGDDWKTLVNFFKAYVRSNQPPSNQ